MSTWNASFEATPAGTAKLSEGDDRIRELKGDIRARMDNEHGTYNNAAAATYATGSDGTTTGDWIHRMGSAMAYYSSGAPTLRPNASTALGTYDKGRLWIDSDDKTLYHWNGSAWEDKWRFADTVTFASTTTHTGVATFTADPVVAGIDSSNTGGISMEIDYRTTAPAESQKTVYMKVIDIGTWNMDTTATCDVAHNLTLSKIISASVMIRDDSDAIHYLLSCDYGSIATGYFEIGATNVAMSRAGGGLFDNTDFNSTGVSRGWIFIVYTA